MHGEVISAALTGSKFEFQHKYSSYCITKSAFRKTCSLSAVHIGEYMALGFLSNMVMKFCSEDALGCGY